MKMPHHDHKKRDRHTLRKDPAHASSPPSSRSMDLDFLGISLNRLRVEQPERFVTAGKGRRERRSRAGGMGSDE